MQRVAMLLWRVTWLRYVGASAISLGIDLAIFIASRAGGTGAAAAAALGYSAGILAHWLLSSRLVFASARRGGSDRVRQQGLFVLSAIVGLLLTVAIVGLASVVGVPALAAKLVAVAVSFQATYLLRARIVFA
jgi:putative flippase GtrA